MQAKTDANLIPSKIPTITGKFLAPLLKQPEKFILVQTLVGAGKTVLPPNLYSIIIALDRMNLIVHQVQHHWDGMFIRPLQ